MSLSNMELDRKYSSNLMDRYSEFLDLLLAVDPDELATKIRRDIAVLRKIRRLRRKERKCTEATMLREAQTVEVGEPPDVPVAAGYYPPPSTNGHHDHYKSIDEWVLEALAVKPMTRPQLVEYIQTHAPRGYVEDSIGSKISTMFTSGKIKKLTTFVTSRIANKPHYYYALLTYEDSDASDQ